MKFMLMFFADEAVWMALPDEERTDAITRIGAWYAEHAQAGRLLDGRRLAGGADATTVDLGSAGRSEEPSIISGPFNQTQKTMGSYAILEAPTVDEAVAVARSWPGGGAVEVRPLLEE